MAVERGRYATLEEGMRATVSIFKSVVANLVKKRKFKVCSRITKSNFRTHTIMRFARDRFIFTLFFQFWMSLEI